MNITGELFFVFSLSTSDQTAATQSLDYQQKTETLTFSPAGSLQRDVSIQILEDNLIENTETLLLTLTTTDTDIAFPNGRTAVISISDDDGMVFFPY